MLAITEPVAWLIGIIIAGGVVGIIFFIIRPSWQWSNKLSAKFDREMKVEDSLINLMKIQTEVMNLREIIPECDDGQYNELVKYHDSLADQFRIIWDNIRHHGNSRLLKKMARDNDQSLRGGLYHYESFLRFAQAAKNVV